MQCENCFRKIIPPPLVPEIPGVFFHFGKKHYTNCTFEQEKSNKMKDLFVNKITTELLQSIARYQMLTDEKRY